MGVSCGALQLVNFLTRHRFHANLKHGLLQREANSVTSGTSSDGMEVRFKLPKDGVGDTLGPFFGLAERQGCPISTYYVLVTLRPTH